MVKEKTSKLKSGFSLVYLRSLLSEDWASSFYGERSYGKEEAEEAYHGAPFLLNAVKELLNRC